MRKKDRDLRDNPEALNSLAILRVNYDQYGDDYIQNFVPFVADILREERKSCVTDSEIQEAVAERLAMDIPIGPIRTIMSRVVDQGFAERQNGDYTPNYDRLRELSIEKDSRDFQREGRALVRKLITFCKEEFGETWTQEEATEALHKHVRRFSASVVATDVRGEELPRYGSPQEGSEYQLQRFIHHLDETDPEGFEYLVNLSKGSMLASVLTFDDVSFYFDTPFILDLIGLDGEEMALPCRELVKLLQSLHATLGVLQCTVNETLGVLDGVSHSLLHGNRDGGGIDGRVDPSLRSSDVRVMAETLDSTLKDEYAIRVEEEPAYTKYPKVNEEALDEALEDAIGYKFDSTRRHDVKALAATYRLRGGQRPRRLESAGAVFVTTNNTLVAASRRHFQGKESRKAPVCLYHHSLATRVWLKSPTEAMDLPRAQIVADSLAALRPADDLWEEYIDMIEHLKDERRLTEEQYQAMKFADDARLALTDVTQNDVNSLDEETIDRMLSNMAAKVRKPVEEKLEEARSKLETVRSKKGQRLLEAQKEKSRIEKQAKEDRAALTETEANLEGVGKKAKKHVERTLQGWFALGALVIGIGLYFLWSDIETIFLVMGGVVYVVVAVAAVLRGPEWVERKTYVRAIRERLIRWMKNRTARRIHSLGVAEEKADQLTEKVFGDADASP